MEGPILEQTKEMFDSPVSFNYDPILGLDYTAPHGSPFVVSGLGRKSMSSGIPVAIADKPSQSSRDRRPA